MSDRGQHGPFCEKVTVVCRMGGEEVRCTCGADAKRNADLHKQLLGLGGMEALGELLDMVRAEEWEKTRIEMAELRAEREQHRQTVKDALYALVDAGSEVACRAILEGKGMEPGIAEEYKSDLVLAREAEARAVARMKEVVAASETALKSAHELTRLLKANAPAALAIRDFVDVVERGLRDVRDPLGEVSAAAFHALMGWVERFRTILGDARDAT